MKTLPTRRRVERAERYFYERLVKLTRTARGSRQTHYEKERNSDVPRRCSVARLHFLLLALRRARLPLHLPLSTSSSSSSSLSSSPSSPISPPISSFFLPLSSNAISAPVRLAQRRFPISFSSSRQPDFPRVSPRVLACRIALACSNHGESAPACVISRSNTTASR